ncbi:FUSC family protein [Alkalibacter mobilis]|uniref:FUSC family protein n=1 Tax=Alkalibacter mobilis TaxID=2787712 RepID=UPI00189D9BFE|nr:aromatic acid exporter family protein [Alkalibacter mobilis]MBF7096179.1 FUSC family protein [Alkalibacter mobilis]
MNYKSFKNYRLGMRNIKTGVAVLISLLLGKYLRMDNSFFIVVAAMLSMESSVMNSVEIGKNRIMGTILGATLGMGLAYLSPGSLVLTSLGIIVIIYVSNLLKWNKAIIIAAFVFLGIMLDMSGEEVFWYSVNRTIDTLIGIGVGLAVNFFIFPYDFQKTLDTRTNNLVELINENVEKVFCYGEKADLEKLKEEIDAFSDEISDYRTEVGMRKKHEKDIEKRKAVLDNFDSIFTHLKVLTKISDNPLVNEDNAKRFAELDFNLKKERIMTEKATDSVYDYHTRAMLKKMEEIESFHAECKSK